MQIDCSRLTADPTGRTKAAAADKRLDLSPVQHLTGFLVAMADAPARRVFQQAIGRPYALREVEFTLLVLLRANRGAAPKQLALALRMPAPHLTLLLDRMAERGLVERRKSPTDGRALEVHLTADGHSLAERVHTVSLTMENAMLERLSPGERAMLRELLIKLAAEPAGSHG